MTKLLVFGLATWRLTKLLTWEFGPFDIFAKIRQWAGVEYDEYGNASSEKFLGSILSCFWCSSVWAAVILTLLPKTISWILSLSTIAILVENYASKHE